jgi:hypothetical protein
MGLNPEIYKPSAKHWAWHPQPGNPQATQWWYSEGIFDNGYTTTIVFNATEALGGVITLDICDPQGNRISEMPTFSPDEIVYSTKTLDVKLGKNLLRGKYPRYELHARAGDHGADLVYEADTQEWMEPRDGVYIGRETFPATTPHFAYIHLCRCKVSGKLTVAGKEILVKGEGYRDHQWGNVLFWDLLQYWYWGKLNFPNHTIMWWETMLQSKYGYQRLKWLWGFKGDKLIEYKNDAKIYVEPLDFKEDPKYGLSLPHKFIVTIDDERIKGTATHSIKSILYFINLPKEMHAGGWTKYIRYVSDCQGEFEMDGEKIKLNSVQIHESGV